MAENLILSEEDQFLLECSKSLKSFVSYYGKTEVKEVDGYIELKRTIPKEWINFIKDVTYSKLRKKGCINLQEEQGYKILYEFFIQDDDIIDNKKYYELVHSLEYKLDMLCKAGHICIEEDDIYCVASDIIASYFYPIISFGNERLYFTDGDYHKIMEIISREFEKSYKEIFNILYIYISDIEHFAPKDRMRMIIEMIKLPEDVENKCVYTYIGADLSGYYKIGRSSNVDNREKSLKTGNHSYNTIIVIKGDFEKELHNKFCNKRVAGEWFELSNDDIKYILSSYDILCNKLLMNDGTGEH